MPKTLQCSKCGKYYEGGPVIEITIEDSDLTWEVELCDVCWGGAMAHFEAKKHAPYR